PIAQRPIEIEEPVKVIEDDKKGPVENELPIEKKWPEDPKVIEKKPDPFVPPPFKNPDPPFIEPSVPVVAQFPPVDPAKLALKPAALEADQVTRQRPATIDDLVVGGGGRFLLFNLPQLSKVGMFDTAEGKVVHYFPAASGDVKIAAGLTKLVMAFP